MVQWFEFHKSTAGGMNPILGWESQKLQSVAKKKRNHYFVNTENFHYLGIKLNYFLSKKKNLRVN